MLSGDGLTVDCVGRRRRAGARASSSTRTRCGACARRARVVERVLASGEAVYGLNTGLGSLSRHRIPVEEIGRFSFATVADQTGIVRAGRSRPTSCGR